MNNATLRGFRELAECTRQPSSDASAVLSSLEALLGGWGGDTNEIRRLIAAAFVVGVNAGFKGLDASELGQVRKAFIERKEIRCESNEQ